MAILRAACAAALTLAFIGCAPPADQVPLDRPVFPLGLAVHPSAEQLVVVSSDHNGDFKEGALLVADLGVVRAATVDGGPSTVVEGAYDGEKSVLLPPFGDNPVFALGGSRVYVPTKGARFVEGEQLDANVVSSIDFDVDTGLSCFGGVVCGQAPLALQLPEADPFNVVVTAENLDSGVVLGAVTLLSSPNVYFFRDDPRREGAARMQILGVLELDAAIAGVESAVLRGARAGHDAHIFASAVLSRALGFVGAQMAVFEPAADSDVALFDLTAATGALSVRDVELVPGEDGAEDAIVVALRQPDAIARFEIDDDAGLPTLRLSALAESCRTPTTLTYAPLVDRVLLTCQDGDAIVSLDPLTLEPTDAVRFFGSAPYAIAVHPTEPEAYVTFFLDNSVGVLRLRDADGKPRLTAVGRIGAPAPPPEDGRE